MSFCDNHSRATRACWYARSCSLRASEVQRDTTTIQQLRAHNEHTCCGCGDNGRNDLFEGAKKKKKTFYLSKSTESNSNYKNYEKIVSFFCPNCKHNFSRKPLIIFLYSILFTIAFVIFFFFSYSVLKMAREKIVCLPFKSIRKSVRIRNRHSTGKMVLI